MNEIQRHEKLELFKKDICSNCFYLYGCGLKRRSIKDIIELGYYKKAVMEIELNGSCRLFKE